MFGKKKPRLLPPDGLGERDISTDRSICTGEATIGFRDPKTGKLLQAVVIRDQKDAEDFYRAYGFQIPQK